MKFELVILAKSIKHNNHCVAGKCVKTGQWLRPVSNEDGGALTNDQVKCANPHGQFSVKTLQKIKMSFTKNAPLPNQPENYVIDNQLWQQNYNINESDVENYLDTPIDLWGASNRIEYSQIQNKQVTIQQSLYLVKVKNLNFNVNDDKRRVSFTYNCTNYDLAVTDPQFDKIKREEKTLQNILCISLGENYDGYCYKLVATIF